MRTVASGASLDRVIVRAGPREVQLASRAVAAVGGHVTHVLPFVDAVSAAVPAATLGTLAAQPGVAQITPDETVHLTAGTYDSGDSGDTGSSENSAAGALASTGAPAAWAAGDRGAGVTVAVVDTGVAPVNDLQGRVIAGPDFSGEHDSTLDSFGHGTVMAGLVAGNGADSGGTYTGMAPQARVLSVKIAGRSGAVDVSTVLAALQWVAAFHDVYGIRVVSLSWGTPSRQSPAVDPLDFAVERLWLSGVVVVVSAGNAGPGPDTVTKPGDDPLVLTATAYDDNHDASSRDDSALDWTSRGTGKPDLAAPGERLIATRAAGSWIDQTYPVARVGDSYIRGSGTSQATAVVAGSAALLLGARPDLTPDQVKYLLTSSAVPLPQVAISVQGAGRLSLARALDASAVPAPVQAPVATGVGSIEQSRGGRHVTASCPGTAAPQVIQGELDTSCQPWTSGWWGATNWATIDWAAALWTAESWSAESWSAESWSAESWSSESWSGGFTAESWNGPSEE